MYSVYIIASKSRVLYIGVTNNLERRLHEHKSKLNSKSFTARYNCSRLVYFENFTNILTAISREKEIKHWRRAKKVGLIDEINPTWEDLPTS